MAANEVGRARISMMVRSMSSNSRPDTLCKTVHPRLTVFSCNARRDAWPAYLVPSRGTVSTAYRWQSEADLEGKTGMCDYSLHAAASRPARTGDKLVISRFPYTCTRGFAAVDESNVAVCVCPAVEVAFDSEVQGEVGVLLRYLVL